MSFRIVLVCGGTAGSGTLCFKETRVPVQNLLDYIEGGYSIGEFLEGKPSVSRDQVIQFLEMGKDQLLRAYILLA